MTSQKNSSAGRRLGSNYKYLQFGVADSTSTRHTDTLSLDRHTHIHMAPLYIHTHAVKYTHTRALPHCAQRDTVTKACTDEDTHTHTQIITSRFRPLKPQRSEDRCTECLPPGSASIGCFSSLFVNQQLAARCGCLGHPALGIDQES